MKKFLLSLIVLVSISQVYAQTSQLLINENFSGYSNGNLNTTSSGQGGTYPWTAASSVYSSDFAQVGSSSPLFYPGYVSGTQYVTLTAKDDYSNFSYPFFHFPDDPAKRFISNTSVSTGSASTVYISFVVNVPSSTNVQSTNNARPEIALRTSNGDNLANFYIADANSGNSLKFGIFKDGSQDGNYSSGNYSFNTTYLIVIRYDIVTGNNNDRMYMWVNPVISSEPTTTSANVSITGGSDGGYSGTVRELQLFQDQYSATATLDGLRVAYGTGSSQSVNAAAAWDALSPVGAPLPVKFGDIKGYTKDKGVQIEWNVYSEINVVKYEIERSTDGVSFTAIGNVTAKNEDGELSYDWYDATPSAGNNYYRIRNVDIDGKSSYSSIVRVSLNKQEARFALYPNPVSGNHISIQATDLQKGDYKIEVFNTAGQQVYKKQFNHTGGTINQSIELPTALQTGVYNIQLTAPGFKLAKQFLIQ